MVGAYDRIKTLQELSKVLENKNKNDFAQNLKESVSKFDNLKMKEFLYNPWFVPEFLEEAVNSVIYLVGEKNGKTFEKWLEKYNKEIESKNESERIGVVLSDKAPFEDFKDFVCIFITGNVFVAKLSPRDKYLWPALFDILCSINPEVRNYIELTDGKLENINRMILNVNKNSSEKFKSYFKKNPCLIRNFHKRVAVLSGKENYSELCDLAADICLYFGLSRNNVNKLLLPKNYDFSLLFKAIDNFRPIYDLHNAYLNNLEYQKTVHLVNSLPFMDQGIMMFKESLEEDAPTGIVYYSYYDQMPDCKESFGCIRNKQMQNCSEVGELMDFLFS